MIYPLVIILLIALCTGAAHGVTAKEAVEIALKNNTELQALRREEDMGKAQLEKARHLLPSNPLLTGTLSGKEKPPQDGSGKYTNYSVTLAQEFEVAGQRGMRIGLAVKNLTKIGYEVRDRERMVTYEVKDAFARALSLKEKEGLTRKVVGIQEELVNFTRIKYRAGSVSGLEVNLAEVELGKARRDLLSTGRELKESLIALLGLMGMKPDPAFTVNGELSPDRYRLPERETLLARARTARPDVKAAAAEVDMALGTVDLTKRQAIPNVTFGGFQLRDEERMERGVLMSVSIPLFDRKQAEKKGAEARVWQARIRKSGLERRLDREVEDAYNNLAYSLQELAVFKKEIISKSMEALGLLNFAFKEGKISFFEVRGAQKDTLEMQFAYLDAMLQTERWMNALERVTGGNE